MQSYDKVAKRKPDFTLFWLVFDSRVRVGGSWFAGVLNSLRLLNKRPSRSQTICPRHGSLVNKDNLFYPEDKNRFAEQGWGET